MGNLIFPRMPVDLPYVINREYTEDFMDSTGYGRREIRRAHQETPDSEMVVCAA